jgi:phosphoglycerate dehydrogenase-like enzyme
VAGAVTARPVVALAMGDPALPDALFSDRLRTRLAATADVDLAAVVTDFGRSPVDLARVEVLLTGWGCPRIDAAALDRLPVLRLVAHAAGTVKGHVDPVCWERGIAVTTAAAANAVPVAEFTLAQVLLANKGVTAATHAFRRDRVRPLRPDQRVVGNYDRTVGVIGASTIGRLVLDALRGYDLDLVLADPTVTAEQATGWGATLLELDELMAVSDVVTLHAPVLPSTTRMIGATQLARMRDGATFLNTARGVLVDHDALRAELVSGRIHAVLDVTDPEPLEPDDVLWDLPNVVLTPHVAGSQGTELHRMAALAVEEVERLATGRPPRHPVTRADLDRMA